MGDINQPSSPPEETISEFRSFVEWILEIDLTPDQEEKIRKVLTEEWAENDRETMALVEANLATFRAVRANNNERFRENWRKHNQPVFVAALEKHASSELGPSLLRAFQAAHPAEASQAAPEKLTAGQIAMGVLGLAGAVALAELANREQAKRELNEAVSRDQGSSLVENIGDIMEVRKREVDELRKKDPAAAEKKDLEYQRMNRELLGKWIDTTSIIGNTINTNMVGGSYGWFTY